MIDVFIVIKVDQDIMYSEDKFIIEVKNILMDHRGWNSKGYNFVFVSKSVFDKIVVKRGSSLKFILRLSQNKTIVDECGFDINEKLSCYNPTVNPPNVLINYYRWMNGSRFSKLSVQDYKKYVINHEVGHALGRDHVTKCICKECKVPVMMQQTISIGKCKPNPWPLQNE
jgi:hypothetical protein